MLISRRSHSVNEPPSHLLIAGQIISRLSYLNFLEHRAEIYEALATTVHVGDLVVLVLFGWFTVPIARFVFEFYLAKQKEKDDDTNETRSARSFVFDDSERDSSEPFYSSLPYFVANFVSQVARVACLVYFFDCLVIAFAKANPDIDLEEDEVSLKFAKLAYSTWAAIRIMSFKRYLLCVAARRPLKKLGKVGVYDRMIDILILVALAITVLDVLKLDAGPGLSSLFAFGGVGTLVFSLASKDLAAQLVSGLVISTSENFYVGDNVKLGKDTLGIIDRIGWLYTDLRGYDEKITRIPNIEVANKRICNISRVKKSQVKQTLRFRHSDWEKISQFCIDVKEEIARSCPELIKDGSRPFRATLREIQEDHLAVVVDTHFNIPPSCTAFFNNKDKVLQIICKVLHRNGIKVALPSHHITLLRRMDDFQQEKGRMIVELEQEEEMLTNTLQKQLEEVRRDKAKLEQQIEHEKQVHASLETQLMGMQGKHLPVKEALDEEEEIEKE